MNPDDLMDARLRAAGERWRAATDARTAVPADAKHEVHDLDEDILVLAPVRRARRRLTWVASAAAVAAAAVGIGFVVSSPDHPAHRLAAPEAGGSSLFGTPWRLTAIHVGGRDVPVDGTPTLSIDGSKLVGSDGCNSISGSASVDGTTLTVTDLASTAVGCVPTDGHTPSFDTVDKILVGRPTWTIDGTTLTLLGPAGELVYSAGAPATPTLTNVEWRLTTVADPQGNALGHAGTPTLRLDDGGALSADDGCNVLSGRVRIVDNTGTPVDLHTTERACLDPAFSGGTTVIDQVLGAPWKWVLEGDTLTVANRHGTLIYRVAPDTSTSGPPGRPSDLLGTWTLTTYEHQDPGSGTGTGVAASSTSGGGPSGLGTTITIAEHSIEIAHACYTDTGALDIATSTLDITHVTLKLAIPCTSSAGSPLDGQADDVLTGTSRWSLDGDNLTIRRGGTSLGFSRSATDTPRGPGVNASDNPTTAPPPGGSPTTTTPADGPTAGGGTSGRPGTG